MSRKGTTFTIGCDPEFFLTKDGKFTASFPYVHGEKGAPQDIGRGNGVMVDNVAIEFCTSPQTKEHKFVQSIRQALKGMADLLPEGIDIVPHASANFAKDELKHPICQEFGCDPDFNAYTNSKNKAPESSVDETFRSCGGHIHVGHKSLKSKDKKLVMIKVMDAIHGLAATILDYDPASIARRKLYGKAGCFRPTSYGVEYRTLSNFWCKSPELVKMVYRMTRDAVMLMIKKQASLMLDNMDADEIQKIINAGDRQAALNLFTDKVVPYLSSHTVDMFMSVAGKSKGYDFKEEWKTI